MESYIGVKMIKAKPGNAPKPMGDHPQGALGMIVEYEDGYTSWSPLLVFDEAYRRCDAMTFGLAIEAMKKGLKVTRKGWNGKGMWIVLTEAIQSRSTITENSETNRATIIDLIVMKTVEGRIIPWYASQTDALAEDWEIVG